MSTYSLEKICEAVAGKDLTIPRAAAFALLAASGYPEPERLLAAVLAESRESLPVRSAAAIALGRIQTVAAEQVLIDCIHKVDVQCLSHILRSLGRIGSFSALAAIDALNLPSDHPAYPAALFGSALICHRLGLSGHDLPFPREDQFLEIPGATGRPIEFNSASRNHSERVVADLKQYPHGIDLDAASMMEMRYGRCVHTLCLSRELTSAGLGRLLERKTIAALVAFPSPETGVHCVSFIVLTAPSKVDSEMSIWVLKSSGSIALAGTARMSEGGLHFLVKAVFRPGTFAIRLEGNFAARVEGDRERSGLTTIKAAVSTSCVPRLVLLSTPKGPWPHM
jgi:hypothetical protein